MHETANDEPTRPAGSKLGVALVRLVVPAYVLFGAGMKYFTAQPDSLPTWLYTWLLNSAPANVPEADIILAALRTTIAIEVAAAGVMLFVPRLARVTASTILAAFMFVLIAEIAFLTRGESSLMSAAFSEGCGCFGSASLAPGYMIIIDGLLLAGVLGFRPGVRPFSETPKWSLAAALIWLVVGISVALNMQFRYTEDESWKLDRPLMWKGMHFDDTKLPEYVEDDWAFFGGGRQTWVLYRESCPVCHNLFEREYSGDLGDRVVVAVQIPSDPGVTLFEAKPIKCPDCQMTKLRDGVTWYINSPTTIEIGEDGIIIDVIDHQLAPHGEDGGSNI